MAQLIELQFGEKVDQVSGCGWWEGEFERKEIGRVGREDEAVAEKEFLIRLGTVGVEDLFA